jgi:hypothetical protein
MLRVALKQQRILVSIIIINYKTDSLTLKAVNSVFENIKDVSFEVIVIDNNSSETYLEEKLAFYHNVSFFKLNKNIGFGKANNLGFKYSKGDYIFLLNSDAFLLDSKTVPGFIDYLKNHENVAIVGANLITDNNKKNICHGRFLSISKILCDYGIKKVSKEEYLAELATASRCYFKVPTVVDHLTGAAIMIKREIVEKHGLFDPRYFMYLEDMDLCFRYRREGYYSVLIPNITIMHLGGQSRIKDPKIERKIDREIRYSKYLFLRNVTNWPTAYFLYILGKFISLNRRGRKRLKSIVNG